MATAEDDSDLHHHHIIVDGSVNKLITDGDVVADGKLCILIL